MIRKAFCSTRTPWRRLLLITGLFAIALGIVAMHQLSSQHLPAVPDRSAPAMHAIQPPTGHSIDHDMTVLVDDGDVTDLMGACATDGCGQHAMMMDCLLALTLIVLGWCLRLPRTRPGPPTNQQRRLRPAVPMPPILSRCPSLVELSISRT